MAAIAVIIGFLAFTQTEAMQEYGRHSNGVQEYSLVSPAPCDGGLHDTGYSISVFSRVVLKQHNEDGTVGKVCLHEN